ncbi:hypothetical protein J3E71DRAFT_242532 [Bipolaris maydis]|nr:hypothetical protein J3E71DRAFT_242532 [Bipolaris maydis]
MPEKKTGFLRGSVWTRGAMRRWKKSEGKDDESFLSSGALEHLCPHPNGNQAKFSDVLTSLHDYFFGELAGRHFQRWPDPLAGARAVHVHVYEGFRGPDSTNPMAYATP